MQPTTRVVVALERFKGLFLDVPNVKLSLTQATEISGLDRDLCFQLLAALVDVRFLTVDRGGVYQRRRVLFQDPKRIAHWDRIRLRH